MWLRHHLSQCVIRDNLHCQKQSCFPVALAFIHTLLPSSLHSSATCHTAMSWDGELNQLKTNRMKGSFQMVHLPASFQNEYKDGRTKG